MKSAARILHSTAAVGLVAVLLFPVIGCHRTYREMLVREGMSGPEAPDWVQGSPQQADMPDEVFFVGRSVGYSVLDEYGAVAAAREDIYRQVAELLATRVMSTAHHLNARANSETFFTERGVNGLTGFDDHTLIRTMPGGELQQAVAREAGLFANAVAGDLIDRNVHFEQWDVRDEPVGAFGRASRGMNRYKCWVLMSIPRDKLDRRVDEFRELVKDSYERYVANYDRALRWEQEDRAERSRRSRAQWEWEMEKDKRFFDLRVQTASKASAVALEDRELRILREEEARHWTREDQSGDRGEARELRRIMAVDHVRFNVRDK
ncbi:MAG: hypothetical protein KAY37_08465 [Phycisphaerae bacterium]|nr:hypothetical protein [Phycisphaerae bacterium]